MNTNDGFTIIYATSHIGEDELIFLRRRTDFTVLNQICVKDYEGYSPEN